ncbi:MAG: hypothetical protein CL891_02370 [Dehalococcoidia bacterium]|nr:hypothetical protein [Dehalococcoidia bacterium]
MPLYEYGCYNCDKISEKLVRLTKPASETTCDHCNSTDVVKLVSKVNFKVQTKAKYDDDFLGKALPAMRKKKETAQFFAEGPKGMSDDAKMSELGEKIGGQVDKMIERSLPKK